VDRDGQLIITGRENGKVVLIAPSGPGGTLQAASEASVEAVLIDSPDFEVKVAATGTVNGQVTIWDVGRQTARVECEDSSRTGVTRLLWGKDCTLIAGTLSGNIRVWDVRSGALKYELLGHRNTDPGSVYNKQKNVLLSTSEDGTVKIFNLP
ncbi:hypothetical protein pipiens_012018, partial [Culex pipiens pipiens]